MFCLFTGGKSSSFFTITCGRFGRARTRARARLAVRRTKGRTGTSSTTRIPPRKGPRTRHRARGRLRISSKSQAEPRTLTLDQQKSQPRLEFESSSCVMRMEGSPRRRTYATWNVIIHRWINHGSSSYTPTTRLAPPFLATCFQYLLYTRRQTDCRCTRKYKYANTNKLTSPPPHPWCIRTRCLASPTAAPLGSRRRSWRCAACPRTTARWRWP